jgi:hypothetical protein
VVYLADVPEVAIWIAGCGVHPSQRLRRPSRPVASTVIVGAVLIPRVVSW